MTCAPKAEEASSGSSVISQSVAAKLSASTTAISRPAAMPSLIGAAARAATNHASTNQPTVRAATNSGLSQTPANAECGWAPNHG